MSRSRKLATPIGAAILSLALTAQAAPRKLGGGLDQMVDAFERGSDALAVSLAHHLNDRRGAPLVRLVFEDAKGFEQQRQQLDALGFRLVAQSAIDPRLVEGYLPLESARFSASLPGVHAAHAVAAPMKHAGSVQSQAVSFERADKVLARGTDGKGIRVGALSDSFDDCPGCSDHAADNVATADLPEVTVIEDDNDPANDTDEGRGMLQLVHDLAPGAALAFATGNISEIDFANNILALRSQFHADVITDDLSYFDEPFFSDGIVAQAVNIVAQDGAAYFSSAGNNGVEGYEADYDGISFAKAEKMTARGEQNLKLDQIPAELRPLSFHDFGNADGSANITNRYTIGPGENNVILQWDEPFHVGKVKTDYNFYLFDRDGNFISPDDGNIAIYSVDDNTQTDMAYERLIMVPEPGEIHGGANTSDYQIVIGKMNGGPAKHLKYVTENALGVSRLQGAPSVDGHCAASGAQAVGAIYYAIPGFPEDFSSPGPSTIYFDQAGNRLRHPDVRRTPQIVAADGTDTTFFIPGDDTDGDGFPNFFGTSAAAPNAAGVAALMLEAAGGPGSLRPQALYAKLQSTATPVAVPDDRGWAAAFAGPVVFTANGDWVRGMHYFGLAVEPFLPAHVQSISFDTSETPTGLTWSANPNRFNVDVDSKIPQSSMTWSTSADASTFTIAFAKGSFGAGQGFRFGMSVFTPIQGSTQEDPDRFREMKITVTLENGQKFHGKVFAAEPRFDNRFTNNGLVNADAAVKAVQKKH